MFRDIRVQGFQRFSICGALGAGVVCSKLARISKSDAFIWINIRFRALGLGFRI